MSEKFALWEAGDEKPAKKPREYRPWKPLPRVKPSFTIHRYRDGGVEVIEPGPWESPFVYPPEEVSE